jgi:hypothetical protein
MSGCELMITVHVISSRATGSLESIRCLLNSKGLGLVPPTSRTYSPTVMQIMTRTQCCLAVRYLALCLTITIWMSQSSQLSIVLRKQGGSRALGVLGVNAGSTKK